MIFTNFVTWFNNDSFPQIKCNFECIVLTIDQANKHKHEHEHEHTSTFSIFFLSILYFLGKKIACSCSS